MRIHDAANGYLLDAPSDWLGLAQAIAGRVARQVGNSLAAEALDIDLRSFVAALSDSLLAILLDPQNVQVVLGANTDDQAVTFITQSIVGGSADVEADSRDPDSQDYWDDIVDVGQSIDGGVAIRRWTGDLGGYADAPRLPVKRIVHPFLNDDDVRRAVESVFHRTHRRDLTEKTDQGESAGLPLVRLDLIDNALYRALVDHPEVLKTLTWRTFERLLADILERFGYTIELQRGTKDGGIDIFALRSDRLGPHRYILQAKRWSSRVGVEPVRQLLFLHAHHRATKSCLATTSCFTEGAWDLAAQYRWQLELRDFEGIREWVGLAGGTKGDV